LNCTVECVEFDFLTSPNLSSLALFSADYSLTIQNNCHQDRSCRGQVLHTCTADGTSTRRHLRMSRLLLRVCGILGICCCSCHRRRFVILRKATPGRANSCISEISFPQNPNAYSHVGKYISDAGAARAPALRTRIKIGGNANYICRCSGARTASRTSSQEGERSLFRRCRSCAPQQQELVQKEGNENYICRCRSWCASSKN
jgi:hypothetical protein